MRYFGSQIIQVRTGIFHLFKISFWFQPLPVAIWIKMWYCQLVVSVFEYSFRGPKKMVNDREHLLQEPMARSHRLLSIDSPEMKSSRTGKYKLFKILTWNATFTKKLSKIMSARASTVYDDIFPRKWGVSGHQTPSEFTIPLAAHYSKWQQRVNISWPGIFA